jgi:hypothetical protein
VPPVLSGKPAVGNFLMAARARKIYSMAVPWPEMKFAGTIASICVRNKFCNDLSLTDNIANPYRANAHLTCVGFYVPAGHFQWISFEIFQIIERKDADCCRM